MQEFWGCFGGEKHNNGRGGQKDARPTHYIFRVMSKSIASIILSTVKMSNIGQSTPNNGHESPDLEVEKMIINAAEKRMTVKMFIGLIGTLLGIIGHHIFLFFVNGHRAESQFWIKTASNAFSQVVVLFMGFIAMSSLTQLVRSMNIALYLLTRPQGLAGIDQGVYPDLNHR